MTKFMMLVGIPGSGKTSYAQHLAQEHNAVIHSSDKIRLELFGDENIQTKHSEVFNALHNRAITDLRAGKNVIYDATNMLRKNRMAFLRLIDKIECEKTCIIIATPVEICKSNNQQRERTVPDYVIDNMANQFQLPVLGEGWDDIKVLNTSFVYDFAAMFRDMIACEHDNPNHSVSIGNHMLEAYKYADEDIKTAALVHDFGKIFVKTFVDKKGNTTDIARYFGHESRGAYELLSKFYGRGKTFSLDNDTAPVLQLTYDDIVLVQCHMYPLISWSEKNQEKWKTLLGEQMFDKLVRLHHADLNAH